MEKSRSEMHEVEGSPNNYMIRNQMLLPKWKFSWAFWFNKRCILENWRRNVRLYAMLFGNYLKETKLAPL
jgi:hypothetical protein